MYSDIPFILTVRIRPTFDFGPFITDQLFCINIQIQNMYKLKCAVMCVTIY